MFRSGGFRRETLKPYRSANPLVWGAWTGIIAALIVLFAGLVGQSSPNTLLEYPFKAGLAFYGFGAMLGMFRNWFNERPRG
jgi:cell division protein FtsN